MGLSNVECPFCHSEQIHRKRRSSVRYREVWSLFGRQVGEYRYFAVHCHHCEADLFLERKYLYKDSVQTPVTRFVDERAYVKAGIHPPGTERVGSTASEYTLRISGGAHRTAFRLKFT